MCITGCKLTLASVEDFLEEVAPWSHHHLQIDVVHEVEAFQCFRGVIFFRLMRIELTSVTLYLNYANKKMIP